MNSCWLKRMTCEEAVVHYNDIEFELILNKVKWNGNDLRMFGNNPNNPQLNADYHLIGDWSYDIGDKFQQGDTLIKVKGEHIIRLFRKNERMSFTYKCENEIVSTEIKRF
jgi:hypothetical protein